MEPITATEHETLVENFRDGMNALMDKFVEDTVAPLRGRTLRAIRKFKEPVTGEFKEHEITVTVTDAHLGYDWELVLVGTNPHPHSGHLVETGVSGF
jgi:hypothetical protein